MKVQRRLACVLTATSLFLAVMCGAAEPDDAATVNPSRPSITNSPGLGTPGALELDLGGGGNSGDWATPLLLKYTLSKTLEIRAGTDGLRLRESSIEAADTALLWLQWAPPVSDRVDFAVAVGASEDGQGHGPHGTFNLSAGTSFRNLRIEANAQSATERDDGGARAAVHSGSLNVSRGFGPWTPFLEGAVFMHTGRSHGTQFRSMSGITYAFSSTMVADVAVEFDPEIFGDATFHFGLSFLINNRFTSNTPRTISKKGDSQ